MAGSASLLWVAAGVIGLISVAPGIDRAVADHDREQAVESGHAISRARDGQFYLDGRIGQTPVRFMVDPDTDTLLIAGPDAAQLGLPREGGTVTLDSIEIGTARQRAVSARVAPAMPVSLIGRAYLSRLTGAEVRGDRLILR